MVTFCTAVLGQVMFHSDKSAETWKAILKERKEILDTMGGRTMSSLKVALTCVEKDYGRSVIVIGS